MIKFSDLSGGIKLIIFLVLALGIAFFIPAKINVERTVVEYGTDESEFYWIVQFQGEQALIPRFPVTYNVDNVRA